MIDFEKLSLVRIPPGHSKVPSAGVVSARLDVATEMVVSKHEWREDVLAMTEHRVRFGIWKQFYGPIRDPLARVDIALLKNLPNRFDAEKLIADLKAAIPAAPK